MTLNPVGMCQNADTQSQDSISRKKYSAVEMDLECGDTIKGLKSKICVLNTCRITRFP